MGGGLAAASFPILIRFCLASSDGDGGDDLLTDGRAETKEREGRKEGTIERTSHRSSEIGKEEGHRRARKERGGGGLGFLEAETDAEEGESAIST